MADRTNLGGAQGSHDTSVDYRDVMASELEIDLSKWEARTEEAEDGIQCFVEGPCPGCGGDVQGYGHYRAEGPWASEAQVGGAGALGAEPAGSSLVEVAVACNCGFDHGNPAGNGCGRSWTLTVPTGRIPVGGETLGGSSMQSDRHPEVPVSESAVDGTSATIAGTVVGDIDGLLWEDVSGVDIVCITTDTGRVAVPVDRGEWRAGGLVELGYDEAQVEQAPLLDLLRQVSPGQAVEQIAEHYSVDLGGPPPGPDPQPLPPWWTTGDVSD